MATKHKRAAYRPNFLLLPEQGAEVWDCIALEDVDFYGQLAAIIAHLDELPCMYHYSPRDDDDKVRVYIADENQAMLFKLKFG